MQVKNGFRTIDLFRELDADGDGYINKKDWRAGMRVIGPDVPVALLDAAFDEVRREHVGKMRRRKREECSAEGPPITLPRGRPESVAQEIRSPGGVRSPKGGEMTTTSCLRLGQTPLPPQAHLLLLVSPPLVWHALGLVRRDLYLHLCMWRSHPRACVPPPLRVHRPIPTAQTRSSSTRCASPPSPSPPLTVPDSQP